MNELMYETVFDVYCIRVYGTKL